MKKVYDGSRWHDYGEIGEVSCSVIQYWGGCGGNTPIVLHDCVDTVTCDKKAVAMAMTMSLDLFNLASCDETAGTVQAAGADYKHMPCVLETNMQQTTGTLSPGGASGEL